jgi:MraZ protein
MLLGTYQAKFASGHRVSVPSQFRKELGQSCILVRWYEGCLVLVSEESWNALYKRLVGTETLIVNPVRDTERFILGSAYNVYPDEQGRIVIPERLALYSGLTDDIYFIGLGEKAEIWDKSAWEAKEKEVIRDADKFLEELAKRNEK